MIFVKGLFLATDGSAFILSSLINSGLASIISATYIYPVSLIWEWLPELTLTTSSIIPFYKVILPPITIFIICALFITDYRNLKAKFHKLKAEIQDEIDKRELRKEAGLETVVETGSVDVYISGIQNNDPAWHNKPLGKVVMAVIIALVLVALGLN